MSTEELLKSLRKEYVESIPEKIREIQELINKQDMDSLHNAFHKLKGSGKTYGFAEISELGALTEEAIKKHSKEAIAVVNQSLSKLQSIYNQNK